MAKTVLDVIIRYNELYPGKGIEIHEITNDTLQRMPREATEEEKAGAVESALLAEL